MTEREKKRLLERAAKLTPKPLLTRSGTWRCQILIDGKRESVTAATPDEAHAQAMLLKTGYLKKKKPPSKLTVEEAFTKYIESKDSVLSPATVKGYKKIKSNHIQDIKSVLLEELTQERVQRWVNALTKQHSAKTVKNAHGLLTAVLREYYPVLALRTTLPQKDAKQIAIPTEDEIKKILQTCAGTEMELPILLALWLGLRASEIRGLKWSDVQDGRLHVCRAIVDGPDGPVEKKTKTVSGDRWIKLPQRIIDLIDQADKSKREYVVSLSGQAMYKRFSRLCESLKIPHYRFHDLRHTAASVAIIAGVPTKYSQQRMGHATDNMLKTVYEHTMRSKEDEYADLINAYYEGIIAR